MQLEEFIKINKIKQIIISNSIKSNHHKLLENINYKKYINCIDRTLFYGMYELNDFNLFNNHTGLKWIFWCGNDINLSHKPRLKKLEDLIQNNKIEAHLYINDLVVNNLKKLNIDGIKISKYILNNFQNHFTFIIPSYNNSKWYIKNLDSIKNQSYTKWDAIYVDDNSNDNTYNLVVNYIKDNNLQNKIKVIKNDKNYKQGYSRYVAFQLCDDNSICCLVDGDDWLSDNYVLYNLNEIYKNNDIMLTYGKYQYFHENKLKNVSGYRSYPNNIIVNNSYQHYEIWIACHMRTGFAKLFKSYPYRYLLDFNNELISATTDINEMTWVLCNSNGKHQNTDFVTYIYNKDASLNNDNSYYNMESNKKTELYRNEILYFITLNELKRYEKKQTILIFTDLNCYNKKLQLFCDLIKFKYKLIFKNELIYGINDIKIKVDHILFYDFSKISDNLITNLKLYCSNIKTNIKYKNLDNFNENDIFTKLNNNKFSDNSIEVIIKNYDIFNDLYSYSLVVNHKNPSPLNKIIDKIYCINLIERNDKLNDFLNQINKFSINCEILRVNKLSNFKKYLDLIKKIPNKDSYITTPGQLGNLISVTLCLLDAYINNYKNIIIFEDDVILKNTFNNDIHNVESLFKENEFIYLGATQWSWDLLNKETNWYTKLMDNYYNPLRTVGFFATFINSNVYKILLKEMLKLLNISDHIPWILYNEKIDLKNKNEEYINNYYYFTDEYYLNKNSKFYDKCIVMYPNLAIANVESSNLRESQNQIKRSKEMHWNLEEYNINCDSNYSYKIINKSCNFKLNMDETFKMLDININSLEYLILKLFNQ